MTSRAPNVAKRALAILLDFSLVGGLLVAIGGERRGLDAVPYLVVIFGYMFVFTAVFGRTPGKMLVRLRVVRVNGRPVGWRGALVREVFARSISLFITFGLTYLVALVRADGRSLDDLLAGTVVEACGE